MIKVGDLVQYQNTRWLAHSLDKMTMTVGMVAIDGGKHEIPVNFDQAQGIDCKVICSPSKDWKVLVAPINNGRGPFVHAEVPAPLGRKPRVLQPWVEWIPSDPFRDGGSVFVHPKVQVGVGGLVVFTHRDGTKVRVTVSRSFAKLSKLKAANQPAESAVKNRFRHLIDDD